MIATSPGVAQTVVGHEAALVALRAAVAKAEELGIAVSAAVFDSGVNLAGFLRMPGAFHISGDVAVAKARTAAATGLSPAVMDEALDAEHARVRRGLEAMPGFTPIHGGLPIVHDGVPLGAVGVSGGSEAQDVACVQAAVDAITAEYGQVPAGTSQ